MEKSKLQYIILSLGTIIFSFLLILLVQEEKGNISFSQTNTEYNQETIEQTIIYSSPNKKTMNIATVASNIKVKTVSETKFYYRVEKVEGMTNIKDGYILKKQLRHLK